MTHHHPRMARERKTVTYMIEFYCKGNHQPEGTLCQDCRKLQDYANAHLEKCPFQENKTTCARCHVHCYKPEMREKIKEVMRYSGPRMLLRHPVLTLHHLLDGFRFSSGNERKK